MVTNKKNDDINQNMTYRKFINREYEFRHTPIKREMEFYDFVKSGNEKKVILSMKKLGEEGSGRLSDNNINNIRYHFVITIAIITRMCVDGGMEMEEAYNLSDVYIMKMDKLNDMDRIMSLHKDAVIDYTRRMKKLNIHKKYSNNIISAIDYIYANLHSRIKLEDVAEAVHLSESYLSKLFHKETGISIGNYILYKRVETARNMLKYSDYSLDEISNYLAFSSTSHFISIFKKLEGLTPGQYRKYSM